MGMHTKFIAHIYSCIDVKTHTCKHTNVQHTYTHVYIYILTYIHTCISTYIATWRNGMDLPQSFLALPRTFIQGRFLFFCSPSVKGRGRCALHGPLEGPRKVSAFSGPSRRSCILHWALRWKNMVHFLTPPDHIA